MAREQVLKVVRPYASVEEFIEAEGWSVTTKGILLIGERPRDADAQVRFEVLLESGEKLFRAEGSVVEYSAERENRPAGLKVRFKRLDAKSKKLVDRIVEGEREVMKRPSEVPRPRMASLMDVEDEIENAEPEPVKTKIIEAESALGLEARRVHRIDAGPVGPPKNREELLERLRARQGAGARVDGEG